MENDNHIPKAGDLYEAINFGIKKFIVILATDIPRFDGAKKCKFLTIRKDNEFHILYEEQNRCFDDLLKYWVKRG